MSDVYQLLGQIAAVLAGEEKPDVITSEQSLVIDSRATAHIAIPQWTLIGKDGKATRRGVVVRAWSYAQRRQAEMAATMPMKPGQQPPAPIDDWRRVVEEVRLGIIEPADLPPQVVESWGYDVVKYLHQQIERLGPVPPELLKAELANIMGQYLPPTS